MNEKYKHHTPTPWRAYDRGIGWEIHGATGEPINGGFRDTFSRADAELCAAAPELLAEVERLRNRVASLEAGYRVAINDLDQDTPRFPAVVAVLDGVVKSVEEYDAYLQHQLDGGQP